MKYRYERIREDGYRADVGDPPVEVFRAWSRNGGMGWQGRPLSFSTYPNRDLAVDAELGLRRRREERR